MSFAAKYRRIAWLFVAALFMAAPLTAGVAEALTSCGTQSSCVVGDLTPPGPGGAPAPKSKHCPKGYYYRDQDQTCVSNTAGQPTLGSGQYTCGDAANGGPVHTSFNFGCKGKGNPIMDLTFAIIRFLSTGVGFVLVASMIWAGIQYTSSRGDPQATAKAVHRIRSNVIALVVFLFAYAILNYVIPGQVLG